MMSFENIKNDIFKNKFYVNIKNDSNSLDQNSTTENYLYTNQNYSDQFFSELRRLFIESKFTDVLLICGEKPVDEKAQTCSSNSIPCHKLVLSALSPYFQAMFSSNLIETQTNKVHMPNTDYKTLIEIINYAYCGSIYLNVSNVQSVFSLASLLQIKNILNACCDFMQSNLDIYNSIHVYTFAKQHMSDGLVESAKEFINKNVVEILKTNEFFELEDVDLICELISCDDLDVQSEEILLNGVLKWIDFDLEKRVLNLERILSNTIRLSLIDTTVLSEIYEKNSKIFSSSQKCSNLIKDCLNNSYNNQVTEIKRSGMSKAQQCFLLIGGNCDLADGSYVNCFNPFNGEKYFLSKSFLDRLSIINKGYFQIENPGVCITEDNRLFIAGGVYVFRKFKTNNNSKSNKSFTESTSNNLAKDDYNSLIDDRNSLKDGDETLSKEVYEYDSLHNTWIKRANMLFPKANFSLCVMNDRIYSFGGISVGQVPLDVIEYYDISENKWAYVGTMPTPFVAGCVVRYEDLFYVLGGRNGVGRHDSCYMFKPETNEWSEISPFNIGRFNFGACVLNDKIYAFGGQRYAESEEHYFTREALDSVEIFDLKSREWCFGIKMPAPLYNTGVCIYDDKKQSIYLCGTTECQYSGTTLFGFMFTSVFRLDFLNDINNESKMKWTVVEHDVSEIKAYYRCIAAKVNTKKLHKFKTDIEFRE